MQLKANQSFIGGLIAFLIATSCCWLPALVIMLGGASSIVAFSSGLEKFSGLFMIVGTGLLSWGSYQFYQRKNNNNNFVMFGHRTTCGIKAFAVDQSKILNTVSNIKHRGRKKR